MPLHGSPSVCLLVLNYNGIQHLDECLRTAVVAASRYAGRCAVVLVDNRSTDGSADFSRRHYPSVEVVVAERNDFLFSLNAVVERRHEDVVIVLNNDMRFDPGFVEPLTGHFADPDVFGVGAAILTWDGQADTVGARCARLERWWFHKWWSSEPSAALTLEACGGAAAYRRSMFVELRGFDPLYRPGYYEDLDLSYRAWANGWKVVYEPRSRAYHKESVSMLARYGDTGKARLLYRNHLLFTIKNLGGASFLLGFLALLPYRVIGPLFYGYRVPFAGFLRALPLMPAAFRARRRRAEPGVDLRSFESVRPLEQQPSRA